MTSSLCQSDWRISAYLKIIFDIKSKSGCAKGISLRFFLPQLKKDFEFIYKPFLLVLIIITWPNNSGWSTKMQIITKDDIKMQSLTLQTGLVVVGRYNVNYKINIENLVYSFTKSCIINFFFNNWLRAWCCITNYIHLKAVDTIGNYSK